MVGLLEEVDPSLLEAMMEPLLSFSPPFEWKSQRSSGCFRLLQTSEMKESVKHQRLNGDIYIQPPSLDLGSIQLDATDEK